MEKKHIQKRVIKIDTLNPEKQILEQAANILRKGGVIAFPTDTSYGLGVNPFNDEAVEKVYTLKGRNQKNPLLVLISNKEQLNTLAYDITPITWELAKAFWPGPLTLILKVSPKISKFKIGSTRKIGVRLPDSIIARSLVDMTKFPITATSANPSGQGSVFSAQEVKNFFGEKLDMILDCGAKTPGPDSTILDVSTIPTKLIRSGAVSTEDIRKIVPLT